MFIAIFLQISTKYLLYASWWIIMVFLRFNVLKMILLSFPNDGFIRFTKLQEVLVAATYKLGIEIPMNWSHIISWDFPKLKSKFWDMGHFRDGPINLSMKQVLEIHYGLKVMMGGTPTWIGIP